MELRENLTNEADILKSCRCCMIEDTRYYQIYDYVDENHMIMEMIDAVVPQINITTDDIDFSTLICETCVNNLLIGYQFQQLCIATDQEFRQQLLAAPEEVLVDAKQDLTMEDESVEETKIEVYDLREDEHEVEMMNESENEVVDVEGGVTEETQEEEGVNSIVGEDDIKFSQEELREDSPEELDENENSQDDGLEENENTQEGEEEDDMDENENSIMDSDSSTLPLKIIKVSRKKRYSCGVCPKMFDRATRIEEHLERKHKYSLKDIKQWIEIVDGADNVTKRENFKKEKEIREQRTEEKAYERAISKIMQSKDEEDGKEEKPKDTKDQPDEPNPLEIVKIAGRKRFKCGDCGKIYDRIVRMMEHLKNKHQYSEKDIKQWYVIAENQMDYGDAKNKPDDGLFTCEECGKQFCDLYRLQRHSIVHSSYKKYGCEICKHRFVSMQNYRNHMKLHEKSDKETSTPTQPLVTYKCPECSMVFGNRNSLSAHCKKHYNSIEKGFTCLECKRNFISKKTLSEHIKRAHPDITYACEHCDRTFGLPDHLERHMGVHRNIQCNICHKKFTTMQTLNDHMNLHSGECPYLCPECGKSFPFAGSLRQHIARHSLVDQFHCTQCGKGFKCKANLKKHMNCHLGLKRRRTRVTGTYREEGNHPEEQDCEQGAEEIDDEQFNASELEDSSW
ncbi:uncharacterized protein [Musca autumnalis]|uniref:uncharacterized protein n=1 Tax=Musca autumnalis TaxID=221902 RepID=UPI003CED1062